MRFDAEELAEVVRAANRLRKAHPRIARDDVWRIAAIAHRCDRGLLADLLDRMRTAPPKNALRYLHGALRGELADRGYQLADCLAAAPPPPPDKG